LFDCTECFGQAKFVYGAWWFNFKLEPIIITSPAVFKNDVQLKSGQKQLKNKQLASLIKILDTLCRGRFCQHFTNSSKAQKKTDGLTVFFYDFWIFMWKYCL